MARGLARTVRVTDEGRDYLRGYADGRAEGAATLRKLLEAIDEAWWNGGVHPTRGVIEAKQVLADWEAERG